LLSSIKGAQSKITKWIEEGAADETEGKLGKS
jgi:hypothetical protein